MTAHAARFGGEGGAEWGGAAAQDSSLEGRRWPEICAALAHCRGALLRRVARRSIRRTPPRATAAELPSARNGAQRQMGTQKAGCSSCVGAGGRRRRSWFRQEIIGRMTRRVRTRVGAVPQVRAAHRLVALLHQPPREHGRRVFLKVLIQQCADLLSQICGVRKPCKFIALQRVLGGGEKKFPGWLGGVQGHGVGPPGENCTTNSNVRVMKVKVYEGSTSCGNLWKTAPLPGRPDGGDLSRLCACSACDGDYEDPERTATHRAPAEVGDADDGPGEVDSPVREE